MHDKREEIMGRAARGCAAGKDVRKARTAPKGIAKGDTMEMIAAREKMRAFLEQMRQKGVKLFVDGEAALPGEIASKAVREGSTYMADYVMGETGTIEQVRFDRVNRQ